MSDRIYSMRCCEMCLHWCATVSEWQEALEFYTPVIPGSRTHRWRSSNGWDVPAVIRLNHKPIQNYGLPTRSGFFSGTRMSQTKDENGKKPDNKPTPQRPIPISYTKKGGEKGRGSNVVVTRLVITSTMRKIYYPARKVLTEAFVETIFIVKRTDNRRRFIQTINVKAFKCFEKAKAFAEENPRRKRCSLRLSYRYLVYRRSFI